MGITNNKKKHSLKNKYILSKQKNIETLTEEPDHKEGVCITKNNLFKNCVDLLFNFL